MSTTMQLPPRDMSSVAMSSSSSNREEMANEYQTLSPGAGGRDFLGS